MSVTYTVSPASGDSYATVFALENLTIPLGKVNSGKTVTVLGSNSNAFKIVHIGLGSGDSSGYGWVSKNDIKAATGSNTTSTVASIVNTALGVTNGTTAVNRDSAFSNYAYSKEKRYQGTDSDYKNLMDKLNYCFGCPPKYNMDIDIQYVSDVGLGRVMSQTYYSNPTILSICPGKAKMFPHLFNKEKRENLFTSLVQAAAGDSSVVEKMNADKDSDILNGSLYEFAQDTVDYAKRVNLLCRACAVLIGIGDEYMPNTTKKLSEFDYAYWSIRKRYSPTTGKTQNVFTDFWAGGIQAVEDAISGDNYIHFLVSSDNVNVSDDIQTGTEESFLQSILGSTNTVASQLSYFAGIGFNNQMDAKDNVNTILNNVIGTNGWTKLVDNVMAGGRLKLPKIVSDTNYSQSISMSMKFISPYGNPKSVFLWCIVPVMHLLALALPKQLSDSMYTYPYVLKVNQSGWFNSNLAVMSSINITRGGSDDTSWTQEGLSTEWNVQFSISPLYEELTLTSTDHPFLFMKNEGLLDYIGNLCGIDLKANNLEVKKELLTGFIKKNLPIIGGDTIYHAQRWVSDKISNTIAKIFSF